MDKQRLRITLKILNGVKIQFLETKKFIEECLEQECLKENISVEEVIFLFTILEAQSWHRKNIFYFVVLDYKAES